MKIILLLLEMPAIIQWMKNGLIIINQEKPLIKFQTYPNGITIEDLTCWAMLAWQEYFLTMKNGSITLNCFFKEMLMFSVFPDGTMGEYERNGSWGLPFAGVTYSTINIEMFVTVADALARVEDFELYEFSTSKGLYGTEGGNKNLYLLIKNYYDQLNGIVDRYVMMDGNLYQIDLINELDQDRHWVNDIWFVKANLYYKDDYFYQTYTRTHHNSKPYPAKRWGTAGPVNYPWSGTGGMVPGLLFMYGGLEKEITVF